MYAHILNFFLEITVHSLCTQVIDNYMCKLVKLAQILVAAHLWC